MLPALLTLAFAASTPQVPQLTPAEWERLRIGEVVRRAESDGPRVTATGVVLVAAEPDALWPAVLDVAARIPENPTLAAVQEYRRESPYEWALEVDMKVLGTDLRIHHQYSWDPAQNVAFYILDPTRPNDLTVADGWYLVRPVDGGSLLVYEAVTEAKVPVPGWIKKWLARDQLEGLLEGIRRRAERGPRQG